MYRSSLSRGTCACSSMQSESHGPPTSAKTHKTFRAVLGVGLFLSLTMVASIEKVILKRLTDVYMNYSFFLAQITTLLFCFAFFSITMVQYFRGAIPEETRAFSLWPFFSIAIFDCIAGILILSASKAVSGQTLTLVLQGVIPFTLFFAVCILRKRFAWQHYVGSTVMMLGIVLALVNSFLTPDTSSDHRSWGVQVFYVVVLVVASVPTSLSGITQERVLGQSDIAVYYLQFWIAFFQFILGWVSPEGKFDNIFTEPGEVFKGLWYDVRKGMWLNLWQGMECVVGRDSNPTDECQDAVWILLIYMILNLLYNVLITYVCKYAGALSMQLAMAAGVPGSFLLFYFRIKFLIPNPSAWSWWVLAGLLVTIVGMIIYHWVPESQAAANDEDGENMKDALDGDNAMRAPLLGESQELE